MWARRLREVFTVNDAVVVALPATEPRRGSSAQRYAAWRASGPVVRDAVEFLVPRVEVDITREWPARLAPRRTDDGTAAELRARVEALGPWDVPFRLGHDLSTMGDDMVAAVARQRLLYRLDLINGTVARLLGEELERSSVLDIGCHSGLFTLDLAGRGARRVDGVDLRPQNIAQARFLARHYGIDNATFEVRDADDLSDEQPRDVVLNLGLLYHVVNPFELIRRTYALCRSFAVIDTVCLTEAVSAFFVLSDKDVHDSSEGKAAYELHPTYRAVIDVIRHGGFSDVVEIVGRADRPHDLYAARRRRCFLALK